MQLPSYPVDETNQKQPLNQSTPFLTFKLQMDFEEETSTSFQESDLNNLSFPISIRLVATTTCALLLVIGSIGNLLIPFVIIKNKELRNSTNFFLVNLSIADLFLLLICAPTAIIELNTQPEVWFLGAFM
ncbi:growth hormone secretagogue receptor type 1-like protein, partial [Dinothrombium tinctorium]